MHKSPEGDLSYVYTILIHTYPLKTFSNQAYTILKNTKKSSYSLSPIICSHTSLNN